MRREGFSRVDGPRSPDRAVRRIRRGGSLRGEAVISAPAMGIPQDRGPASGPGGGQGMLTYYDAVCKVCVGKARLPNKNRPRGAGSLGCSRVVSRGGLVVVGADRAEHISAKVAVEHEAEPITGPEPVANHSEGGRYPAGADIDLSLIHI